MKTEKVSDGKTEVYQRFYKYGKIPQLSIFACTFYLAARK